MQAAKAPPLASTSAISVAEATFAPPALGGKTTEASMGRPLASMLVNLPMLSKLPSASPYGSKPVWQPLQGAVLVRYADLSRSVASANISLAAAIWLESASGKGGLVAHSSAAFTSSPRPTTDG